MARTRRLKNRTFAVTIGVTLAIAGCGEVDPKPPVPVPEPGGSVWFLENTISQRSHIEVPSSSATLDAAAFERQLETYDPGRLLRCAADDNADYQRIVDEIGGVSWAYDIRFLEDESKPIFAKGFPAPYGFPELAAASDVAGNAVEIEESDIVGISDDAALYISHAHGLLLVDVSGEAPVFECATKLPGQVSTFYYHRGHLIVMVAKRSWGADRRSYLLHFKVNETMLSFVEAIDLGATSILDSRRFNDRLVFYTDMQIAVPPDPVMYAPSEEGSGAATAAADMSVIAPTSYGSSPHRMLRVFSIGDTLEEELSETLLDTGSDGYLDVHQPDQTTPIGTEVRQSSNYGPNIWASDHYFVVTKAIARTYLTGWETRDYSVCTESHEEEHPYRHCQTIYETRPNPYYKPADNSGGDRACQSTTLSDCLRRVSRESNETIEVPVGTECETRIRQTWVCDRREWRSYTYPTYETKHSTKLFIYEYTDGGFIRLDGKVREIVDDGFAELRLSDSVEKLTTSEETFDLLIDGAVQTLYFQNGFLYVISAGYLQVYAMAENSLVRTSAFKLVNDQLQTVLFTDDKIFLSDFRYGYGSGGYRDRSTLKVVDLANPAFPNKVSTDHELPGGHSSILPTSYGILTIGMVQNFTEDIRSVLKLGLFSDPYTDEEAYLILGTDLNYNSLGQDESYYFAGNAHRLFLPYTGYRGEDFGKMQSRVGVSHLEPSAIVSEGAVGLPEPVARIRAYPAAKDGSVLTFADNSIHWLTPKGSGEAWNARPVLEYFTPVALYRVNDDDEWAELLTLGNECKLRIVAEAEINDRKAGVTSERFSCVGGVYGFWAYGDHLIFSERSGIRFTREGAITALTADELEALYEARPHRPICLFSEGVLEPGQSPQVDFDDPPSLDTLFCLSSEEYARRLEAHRATATDTVSMSAEL